MVPPARTIANDTRLKTLPPSTASSPSLRSKTPVNVPMTPSSSLNPGGNVKVVVRVRGFLPRGKFAAAYLVLESPNNVYHRNRQRCTMFDCDEPRQSIYKAFSTAFDRSGKCKNADKKTCGREDLHL